MFWGGREGYQSLWNTNMKRELDHLAEFMHMAVDYAKQIGFTGQFLFEPKPKEPTKHQYDFDARGLRQLPPQLRADRPRQAEPRNQPRHAGRPHHASRAGICRHARAAGLDGRQHAATCCWAGTPISSQPTSI